MLPLPEEVTGRILTGTHLTLLIDEGISFGSESPELDEIVFSYELSAARRGLPQGSAASPLVAEMLLAPVLNTLPDYGIWTGYADNFLATGQTEEDVASISKALYRAPIAHPAGPLSPKPRPMSEPGQPIQFLGHCLTKKGEQVWIEPSQENRERFEAAVGLTTHAMQWMGKQKVQKTAARLRRYVRSWTSSFKSCTEMEKVRKLALKKIEAALP